MLDDWHGNAPAEIPTVGETIFIVTFLVGVVAALALFLLFRGVL